MKTIEFELTLPNGEIITVRFVLGEEIAGFYVGFDGKELPLHCFKDEIQVLAWKELVNKLRGEK
jgi:hypothetical protein